MAAHHEAPNPAANSAASELDFVRSFFRDLPDAVIFADRERRIVVVNPAVEQLFGYAPEELIGKRTAMLYASEAEFAAQGQARYNPDGPLATSHYTIRYRRKNGEIFPSETIGAPIRGTDGEVAGYLGIIRDTSDRQLVLDVLHRLYEITSKQELSGGEKVQAILELGAGYFRLPLGIVSRIEGNVYTVLYAASPGGEIAPGHRFDLAGTYCVHTLAADGPTSFHHAGTSEIATHPCYARFGLESYIGVPLLVDGERFGTLNYSGPAPRAPFTATEQEFIRLFAEWIANELSRERSLEVLRQARAEAEESRGEAEAASEAKSRFLATMSHELRTPMTGLLGMLDLLETTRLDQEQSEYLKQVRRCGLALRSLLDDVLDLSKIEAGRLQLEARPFDLHELADSVAANFETLAHQKGLTLELTLGAAAPRTVVGDSVRIRQILANLASNAVKFTQSGGVTIAVDRVPETGALTIEVSDTGIGVPEAVRAQVFEAFEQAEASTTRRFGGTGLGLAICRQLVEAMGGTISVDSVVGQGSRFRVVLPLEVPASAAQPIEADAPSESGARDNGGVRLLVAEDNEVNGMLLRSMLQRLGHSVTLARNGREALAAIESDDFDVAVLDMQMPVMDGIEATLRIRALDEPKGSLPVIALTADAVDSNRAGYEGIGLSAFLTKPIDWSALDAAVRRHAGTFRAARQAESDEARLAAAALGDGLDDGPWNLEAVPILDAAYLAELAEGVGTEVLDNLLAVLAKSLTKVGEELRAGVWDGDLRVQTNRLHSLRGQSLTFGAKRLGAAAELCERSLEAAALSSKAAGQLEAILSDTLHALRHRRTAG